MSADYRALFDSVNSRWHDGSGEITYSFPSEMPDYYRTENGQHILIEATDGERTVQITLPEGTDIGLNQGQQAMFEQAIQAWNDVANVNLVRAEPGTDGDVTLAGSAELSNNGREVGFAAATISIGPDVEPGVVVDVAEEARGDIWLNHTLSEIVDPVPGIGFAETYVHELGHAFGLVHFDEETEHPDFTRLDSVFSDNSLADHDFTNAGAITPMVTDIQAVQALYGANYETRSGDSVYFGPGDNSGFALTDGGQMIMTVWDGGGEDTIDASHQSGASLIDLTPGGTSSIGGLTSNIRIATAPPDADGNIPDAQDLTDTRHFIENATGGAGNDTIIGNVVANKIDGGAGADTVSYAQSKAGVVVDLGDDLAESGGDADGDRLAGIENVTATRFDDIVRGDSVANLLRGEGGNDTLIGADGDTLQGGEGSDTLLAESGQVALFGGTSADLFQLGSADAASGLDEFLAATIHDFDSEAGDRISVAGDFEASIVELDALGTALRLEGENWQADILGAPEDLQALIDNDLGSLFFGVA